MTQAAGPHRPADTGQLCALCQLVGIAICSQRPEAAVLKTIYPFSGRHTCTEISSPGWSWHLELYFYSFLYHLFILSCLALDSTFAASRKIFVFKRSTTGLNLIKDIRDNSGAIEQQCFQHSAGVYIPLAQSVTAVSFISL